MGTHLGLCVLLCTGVVCWILSLDCNCVFGAIGCHSFLFVLNHACLCQLLMIFNGM